MIFCTTCKHRTAHERVTLANGGSVLRCVKCWTMPSLKKRMAMFKYRTKNPRQLSARDMAKKSPELRKAAKLLTDFTGRAPVKLRRHTVKAASNVRLQIGKVTGIMYLARDGKKMVHYLHRFRAGSRPSLTATPDGKRIELLGGAFRFTDRGIVDSSVRSKT